VLVRPINLEGLSNAEGEVETSTEGRGTAEVTESRTFCNASATSVQQRILRRKLEKGVASTLASRSVRTGRRLKKRRYVFTSLLV